MKYFKLLYLYGMYLFTGNYQCNFLLKQISMQLSVNKPLNNNIYFGKCS